MKRSFKTAIFTSGITESGYQYRPTLYNLGNDRSHLSSHKDFLAKIRRVQFDLMIIDCPDSIVKTIRLLDSIKDSQSRDSLAIFTTSRIEKQYEIDISGKAKFELPGKLILRRKHGEYLYDQDRLAIVMKTAATLSHEINNPLMAISANAEMLIRNHSHLSRDMVDKIELIVSAVDRIRIVTDKLAQLEVLNYRDTAAGEMISLDDSSRFEISQLQSIIKASPE